MNNSLKIACIQMDSIAGNITVNMTKAARFLAAAKAKGADLAILPELFNVGYDLDRFIHMKYYPEESLSALSELAGKNGLYVVAGILEIENGIRYNTAVVMNNHGEFIAKYRKINLFPLSEEAKVFSAGSDIVTFTMGNFRFGILICFDIRFPELSREFFKQNCSAIIVCSAFLFPRLDHWRTLLKARAIENQMYVLAANRVGREGGNWFLGNSCIIDPWGVIAAAMDETEEGVIFSELSMDKLIAVKKMMPCNPVFAI